jgi:hypothetical protein
MQISYKRSRNLSKEDLIKEVGNCEGYTYLESFSFKRLMYKPEYSDSEDSHPGIRDSGTKKRGPE